jgi:hypothetical protein
VQQEARNLPSPRDVDPARLVAVLESAGWRLVGARAGVYKRLVPPGEDSVRWGALVIPIDAAAPEYEEQMAAALSQLNNPALARWVPSAMAEISHTALDGYRVSKETGTPSGFIRWTQGERLIEQTRLTLMAGAKSHVSKFPHYGNRLGQFAKRFLESTLMGQTEPGSYVVTAYVPVEEAIPLHAAKWDGLDLERLTSARTRDITKSIVRALEATNDALTYFRKRNSYVSFEENVSNGVSYEMLTALSGIADDSDGAEIAVELDPANPDQDLSARSVFAFRPTDAPVLYSAGIRLLEEFPRRVETMAGRVHLLRKEDVGLPGTIGLEVPTSAGLRRVRVYLTSTDDYNVAVRAHVADLWIQVTGELTREGNQYALVNAAVDAVVGPADAAAEAELDLPGPSDSPGLF